MFYKMDDQSLFFYGRLIFDLHFGTFLHLLNWLRKKSLSHVSTAPDIVLSMQTSVHFYRRKIFMRSSTAFNFVRFFKLPKLAKSDENELKNLGWKSLKW